MLSEGALLVTVDLRWTLVEHRNSTVILARARHFYLRSSVHIFSLPLREGLDLARDMAIRLLL